MAKHHRPILCIAILTLAISLATSSPAPSQPGNAPESFREIGEQGYSGSILSPSHYGPPKTTAIPNRNEPSDGVAIHDQTKLKATQVFTRYNPNVQNDTNWEMDAIASRFASCHFETGFYKAEDDNGVYKAYVIVIKNQGAWPSAEQTIAELDGIFDFWDKNYDWTDHLRSVLSGSNRFGCSAQPTCSNHQGFHAFSCAFSLPPIPQTYITPVVLPPLPKLDETSIITTLNQHWNENCIWNPLLASIAGKYIVCHDADPASPAQYSYHNERNDVRQQTPLTNLFDFYEVFPYNANVYSTHNPIMGALRKVINSGVLSTKIQNIRQSISFPYDLEIACFADPTCNYNPLNYNQKHVLLSCIGGANVHIPTIPPSTTPSFVTLPPLPIVDASKVLLILDKVFGSNFYWHPLLVEIANVTTCDDAILDTLPAYPFNVETQVTRKTGFTFLFDLHNVEPYNPNITPTSNPFEDALDNFRYQKYQKFQEIKGLVNNYNVVYVGCYGNPLCYSFPQAFGDAYAMISCVGAVSGPTVPPSTTAQPSYP